LPLIVMSGCWFPFQRQHPKYLDDFPIPLPSFVILQCCLIYHQILPWWIVPEWPDN
jgi:hypothetical protein